MMEALYPFHPRLVHFPIALSLVGAAFVVISYLQRRDSDRWFWAGWLLILLGWVGAVVAGIAGLMDQSRAPDLPVVHETINSHITAGIALIATFGLALYWPLRNKQLLAQTRGRWAYGALLLLGVALVLIESWLGGQLVYKLGVGVQ